MVLWEISDRTPRFGLSPLEKSEQRLNLLLRLMKRKDVTALINACDAGREAAWGCPRSCWSEGQVSERPPGCAVWPGIW